MEVQADRGENVLDLGLEGGGLTILRRRSALGGWEYYEESSSMGFDEDDVEVWHHRTSEAASCIEDLFGPEWVWFLPIRIHPEYREDVWELVQRRAKSLEGRDLRIWNQNEDRWRECCGRLSH